MKDFQSWAPIAFPGFPGSEKDIWKGGVQSARSAYRQIVRTGKKNGQLLENIGAQSDFVIRPELSDIMGTTNTQLDRISKILRAHPRTGLVFDLTPTELVSHNLDNDFVLTFDIAGFKRLEIESAGDKRNSIELKSMFRQKKDILLNKTTIVPSIKKYEIFGVDYLGERQYRAIRNVKYLPSLSDYLQVTKSVKILENSDVPFVVVYQPKETQGWKFKDSKYTVGDGNVYTNSIDSTLSVFATSDKAFSTKISLDYDTEKDYDFIIAGYITNGKRVEFFKVSGNGKIDQTFEIPAGTHDIFIQFLSDPFSVAKGAELREFSLLVEDAPATVVSSTTSVGTTSAMTTTSAIEISSVLTTSAVETTSSVFVTTSIGTTTANSITSTTSVPAIPTITRHSDSPKPTSAYPTLTASTMPADETIKPSPKPDENPYDNTSSGKKLSSLLGFLVLFAL